MSKQVAIKPVMTDSGQLDETRGRLVVVDEHGHRRSYVLSAGSAIAQLQQWVACGYRLVPYIG